MADGDTNHDQRIDRAEFDALAAKWFGALDTAGTGRVSQADFAQRFAVLTSPAPTAGPAGVPAGGPGGQAGRGGRGGGAAGPMFTAADADRDGAVTRDELSALFRKWFDTWDSASGGALTEEQVVAGVNAALPQPAGRASTPPTAEQYARLDAMAKADSTPGFTVNIPRAYYIGKFEVTQAQWKKVMGTNPSLFQGAKVADDADKHPVEGITWEDAQAFVKKLNALEKTSVYRLPTEFEWEYAARAGADADTPWTQIREQAIAGYNTYFNTHMVGEKKPNAWGLYDTLGNVWEWVQDSYNEKIFADPTPPKSGKTHVLKGGGFLADVKNAIPATHAGGPGSKFDVGVRLVRDVR
jgi:formylglycine-generating enzyme required for sulfatase activity